MNTFVLKFCENYITDKNCYTLNTGDEENTQDDEQLSFASNLAKNPVKFKSVSVSDRGLRVVPIHLIKHQTAPLITEEMIQEQKILRQKYLSKKVSLVTMILVLVAKCVQKYEKFHLQGNVDNL